MRKDPAAASQVHVEARYIVAQARWLEHFEYLLIADRSVNEMDKQALLDHVSSRA